MATSALPFQYGDRDVLAKLNSLHESGMPRMRADPKNIDSPGVAITVDRRLVFEDNGEVGDVMASVNIYTDVSTLRDGWSCIIHVVAGTATINVAEAGAFLGGATTSKTVTAGNGCILSSNGVGYRIFRFVAT